MGKKAADLKNMTEFNYYEAPAQHVFEDIKQAALSIWSSYDDTYGYASEKMNRIKDLENISDNAWYMVAMFDMPNQRKLLDLVQPETADLIVKATNASSGA